MRQDLTIKTRLASNAQDKCLLSARIKGVYHYMAMTFFSFFFLMVEELFECLGIFFSGQKLYLLHSGDSVNTYCMVNYRARDRSPVRLGRSVGLGRCHRRLEGIWGEEGRPRNRNK